MSYWGGEPITVGTVEQLLIDDHVVEDAWDVQRQVCAPLRHPTGPVLQADRPWEANICPWRVLHDPREGGFHMYYQVINAEAWNFLFAADPGAQWSKSRHGSPYMTCYARSADGFHWEKPSLDVVPWRDHERTNILADGNRKSQAVDVALVPDAEDEQRRLVMAYRDIDPDRGEQCRYFAWSADGLRWTPDPANPIVRGAGDGADVLVHDPVTRRWQPLPGAQMRYLAYHGDQLLAALGCGAAAWALAPRDRWIGWTAAQRQRKLDLVVNNARFLILPWVRSPNLASRLLGQVNKRLPSDWRDRYGYSPVLLETFVEQGRHRGTCYRAANWIHVGQTQGRGKMDRYARRLLPIKGVRLYPLCRSFRRQLSDDD